MTSCSNNDQCRKRKSESSSDPCALHCSDTLLFPFSLMQKEKMPMPHSIFTLMFTRRGYQIYFSMNCCKACGKNQTKAKGDRKCIRSKAAIYLTPCSKSNCLVPFHLQGYTPLQRHGGGLQKPAEVPEPWCSLPTRLQISQVPIHKLYVASPWILTPRLPHSHQTDDLF